MSRIDWAGLMRLGLVELRLTPEVFWALTPGELLLIAGAGPARAPLTRAGLAALLARFPDGAPSLRRGIEANGGL